MRAIIVLIMSQKGLEIQRGTKINTLNCKIIPIYTCLSHAAVTLRVKCKTSW